MATARNTAWTPRSTSEPATWPRSVLTGLARAKKTAETTRRTKNDAIDEYDSQFRYVAGTLEGLFHLAGMHDAAERVRPSIRRPGRTAAGDSESDSGDPPTDQDPPADESAPDPTAAAASDAS